ncbi:MAG: YfhO family protein, partial [Bacteroidales bacterium]|nr:YfhO family protein [Bacteroidales bacterium]
EEKKEQPIINAVKQTNGPVKEQIVKKVVVNPDGSKKIVTVKRIVSAAPKAEDTAVANNPTKKVVKSMPTYWGEQPITSGPVYIGAIVIFLFIFGLLYVEGTTKWWLALASLFSILLAWGHNFMPLTDLFLDYFPGYNKFRTVSMILVVAEFTMPLLAILALKKFFEDEQKELAFKKLAIALGITGGFLLLLIFTSGLWSFAGTHDSDMLPEWLLPSLIADRKAMMSSDLWRSLLLVIITFAILSLVRFQKLKQIPAICLLSALVMVDMIPVNKRFLNNDDFVKPAKDYFKANAANKMILADKDPNFRVMNFTVSPFNDASTSYFHKSIGGYHGAKMKRYQELIDSCLSQRNFDVYNMLNTKYFIIPGENQQPIAQRNPEALGNAWFVESIHMVPNADTEIQSLKDFNPEKEAFVDMRFTVNNRELQVDSTASITLNSYAPMDLVYTSNNSHDGVAIFSEIYYDKGWNAYIDGEKVPHFRANYVLRGLEIPAGQHQIEFKFEPQTYYTCNRISLISSVILLLGFLAAVIWEVRKKLASNVA